MFSQESPFEGLLLSGKLFELLMDFIVILIRNRVISNERVIEEARFKRWTVTQPSPIQILKGLTEEVSR